MATPNCTHVHTDDCVLSEDEICDKAHTHTDSCAVNHAEHIHSKACCVRHMHTPVCYGAAANTPTSPPSGAPKIPDQGELYVSGWTPYQEALVTLIAYIGSLQKPNLFGMPTQE